MEKVYFVVENGEIVNKIKFDLDKNPLHPFGEIIEASLLSNVDIGYKLNLETNIFENPTVALEAELSLEQQLEEKAFQTIEFGTKLFVEIKRKVWATNAAAVLQGNPMSASEMLQLLEQSNNLRDALEGGAIDTAAYVCSVLKTAMPQYADICDWAMQEIQNFNDRQG